MAPSSTGFPHDPTTPERVGDMHGRRGRDLPVQHELRKRIFARFRREGITIPFPQRDVHIYEAEKTSWPPPEVVHSARTQH